MSDRDLPKLATYNSVDRRGFRDGWGQITPQQAMDYADAMRDELLARIAELEEHAEHDEDNLEGLQHALVRANQQYTQAEAERDALRDRRCEGCEHVRHHAVGKPHAYRLCALGNSCGYDAALPDDFACNRWQPRKGIEE